MNSITTNREFLRNFRDFKDKLKKGEIDAIVIPQDNEMEIHVRMSKKQKPFDRLSEKIKKNPIKGLARPLEDLF